MERTIETRQYQHCATATVFENQPENASQPIAVLYADTEEEAAAEARKHMVADELIAVCREPVEGVLGQDGNFADQLAELAHKLSGRIPTGVEQLLNVKARQIRVALKKLEANDVEPSKH